MFREINMYIEDTAYGYRVQEKGISLRDIEVVYISRALSEKS